MERCKSKCIKLHFSRMNKPRNLMYNMRTVVNNIVLHNRNLLRKYILGAFTTRPHRPKRGNLVFVMDMFICLFVAIIFTILCQNLMLYALNIHNKKF